MTWVVIILLISSLANSVAIVVLGRTLIIQGRIIRHLRNQKERGRVLEYFIRPDME